ncbi:MAG: hypothetical protein IBX64_02525 [Actinobacteria bacterium]|nr:hypothetical protein [Actinomycetota bacterium]
MIVLLTNLGAIVLSATSIFLVWSKGKDRTGSYTKKAIIIVSICLIFLASTNMLYHNSRSDIFITAEIYFRVSIAILWFLLIYRAIYGEIREEARRREKELEALNGVALAVGQSMHLPQILHNALLSVIRISNFDIGFVYLLNKKKSILELATAYGNIPEDLAKKLLTLQLGQEV